MKNLKITALLLASLLCMASFASCGDDEESSSSSVSLNIEDSKSETTTSSDSESTSTTTADSKSTTTSTASTSSEDSTEAATEASGETTEKPAEESKTEAPQQQTDAPSNNNTSAPEQPQEQTNEDIVLSVNDLFTDTNAMLAKLGSYESTSTAPACTQSGSDITTYVYKGVEIMSYNDGSGDRICNIKITGSNYKTPEGIKIGSQKAEAESAYGTDSTGWALISADKEVYFTFSGDTVSVIEFCGIGV